jgi:hypothetical protein
MSDDTETFRFTEAAVQALDLDDVARCWNRVSRNPKKHWQPCVYQGGHYPMFQCKDGPVPFVMIVIDEEDGGTHILVMLASEAGTNN